MDRIILLALLGIPVLIVIPVAMFAQGLSPFEPATWSQDQISALQGHWQTRETPPLFVINRIPEQGS